MVKFVLELSDKICIYFTDVDFIYYCLQNFAWTHQNIINLIHSHTLILFNSHECVRVLKRN